MAALVTLGLRELLCPSVFDCNTSLLSLIVPFNVLWLLNVDVADTDRLVLLFAIVGSL